MATKEKKEKQSKTPKVPKIFRKPVSEKIWEKKFIGKIFLPDDRQFLESHKVLEDKFVRIDSSSMNKKEQKRLKALGKIISANRKGMNFMLLLILFILVGGSIVWQFILKDKIITNLVEEQLEQVFQAQVDIKGLDLSVAQGFLTLDHIAIADQNDPMMNLVELSEMEASIDTYQLTRGRLHITELGFKGLQRSTERSTSGALVSTSAPAAAPSETDGAVEADSASDEPEEEKSSPMDQISASLGKIDPQEILEQEMENLESPEMIMESIETLEDYQEYWEEQISQWSGKEAEWRESVNYISSINESSFQSIESAQSTLTRLANIAEDAERDLNQANQNYNEVSQQWQEVSAMYSGITTAVEADYTYLQDFISMPAGAKLEWAAQILEDQLGSPITDYLGYINKGMDFYTRFQAASTDKEKTEEEIVKEGRSLPIGPNEPPKFVLAHAFVSGVEGGLNYEVELFNITSNPDQWAEIPAIDLAYESPATGVVNAMVSLEKAEFEFQTLSFDLGSNLEALGLDSLSGQFSLQSEIKFQDDGLEGSLDMKIPAFNITSNSDDMLSRVVVGTLKETRDLDIHADLAMLSGDMNLAFQSELDNLLSDAMGKLLEETAKESLKMLEAQFGEELAGPLDELESLMGDFDVNLNEIGDFQKQLGSLEDFAEQKRQDIEEEIRKNIEREAEKALEGVIEGALDGGVDGALDSAADSLGGLMGGFF